MVVVIRQYDLESLQFSQLLEVQVYIFSSSNVHYVLKYLVPLA